MIVQACLGHPVRVRSHEEGAELLYRARQHGLAGAVSTSLLASGDGVPDQTLLLAREMRAATVARHLRAVGELESLGIGLRAAGIPYVVVKGPALVAVHHPLPTARAYGDLDILVGPADLERTLAVMEQRGCSILTRNWTMYVAAVPAELALATPAGTPIDLHWHLVHQRARRMRRAIRTEELLARRRVVSVGGVELPTLEATDTLLHLCMHGADSGGDRLLWLYDVHSAVAAEPPDWRAVLSRSRRYRITGPVALMLDRARRTFGTPVPHAVIRGLGQVGWTSLDAIVQRALPLGSAYPRGSLSRTLARATEEDPMRGIGSAAMRGIAWARQGGMWAGSRTGWLVNSSPGSGRFDGGGDVREYLEAVRTEVGLE